MTMRIGGIKLNTKTVCWLKQASVSVEKVIAPVMSLHPSLPLGSWEEEETGGMEVGQCAGGQAWLCLT